MKYQPKIYARAFSEVASQRLGAEEKSQIVKNFLNLIVKNGDSQQLKKIFQETEKLIRLKSGLRKITLETARPLKKQPKDILKNFIKSGDLIEEKINPELIAGLKIIVNDGEQLDGTLKWKIDKMFT